MTARTSHLQLPPIVSREWVSEHLNDETLFLADVRWYLDGRSGREAFAGGHLPGATFVDMDTDLSDHTRPATEGRHPLPSPTHFAAAMGRLGLDRYRGETEPIDPRAGHVPGAANAPWSANLDPATGRFKEPMALRIAYETIGVTDAASTICYCGSGVSACADVLGIEHAGLGTPRLFVASWSGWSSDPGRPVATGE